jgi:Tol biopolymer transport system component
MGVVYMAEQREPVRRKVALKVVKPGMDTRAVVARFEAERQALAMMDHPNIAHVLDAGATESGKPYFVMELVPGVPITEFCDRNDLTMRERLELFIQVCQAVQHAHQKGIIHRDLKPSNVLVTSCDGVPVPKIIDFGVAKATNQQLTDKSAFTSFGQIIGTPLYMSPEQAEMNCLDVDTRSDIYSLGVLLHELLTGTTPFDNDRLREIGIDEVRRVIREEEPVRPSTRVSTLGAAATTVSMHRKTDPIKLSHALRGELDWIVMKALAKDRSRRYQTVIEFAKDIDCYLNDEPVQACRPSPTYRFRKFARRYRAQLLTAFGVAGILVAGTLVSTCLAAWAVRAQGIANTRLISEQAARRDAQRSEAAALDARAIAEKQEQLAEQQRDAAEYDFYVASVRLAEHYWGSGQVTRMADSLLAIAPKPGRPASRGWEWSELVSRCHRERLVLPFQYFFGWSPDGKYLATADHFSGINIWDVRSGKRRAFLKECPVVAWAVSWSPDGKHVAAGTDRGTVVIWEFPSGKKLRSLLGGGAAVHSVDWSPEGDRLAVGEGEGVEFAWDTRQERHRAVLSENSEATIRIWDWRAGKTLASLIVPSGPVSCLDWHPDGRQLLGVYDRSSSQLKIWDTSTGKEIAGWPTGYGRMAAFSPDGRRVVSGAEPVKVMDLNTRKVVSSFPRIGAYYSTWSPSGERLASTGPGGVIDVWDAASGSKLGFIPALTPANAPMAGSPTGEFFAAQSPAAVIRWTARTCPGGHRACGAVLGDVPPGLDYGHRTGGTGRCPRLRARR